MNDAFLLWSTAWFRIKEKLWFFVSENKAIQGTGTSPSDKYLEAHMHILASSFPQGIQGQAKLILQAIQNNREMQALH